MYYQFLTLFFVPFVPSWLSSCWAAGQSPRFALGASVVKKCATKLIYPTGSRFPSPSLGI